jgi:gluconokinase
VEAPNVWARADAAMQRAASAQARRICVKLRPRNIDAWTLYFLPFRAPSLFLRLKQGGMPCEDDRLNGNANAVIVMGVSGAGKTAVGSRLAEKLGCGFYEGDDFHSAASIEKMRRGDPLTDEDRLPWLDRLRGLIVDELAAGECAVIACSALRDAYRKRLVPADPELAPRVRFVCLYVSPEIARERLMSRRGHFMPATLVSSQFETLEEPAAGEALCVDGGRPVDEVVEQAYAALQSPA